jgi:mannose-1-phosphate guanylyltransferase / phosphomannomutase
MKTIILVGGYGMRLRPLTNNVAKPMVPLVNRPFVTYIVELLKQHNMNEIIFSSFYLPESIQNYFGDGSKFGVSIEYCLEETPLGTAGAIKNCAHLLRDETFMIFNGDILTDLNLSAFLDFHRTKGAVATVSLGRVIDPTTYGMVDVGAEGRAIRWYEKPSWDEATSRWVNIGACLLEPEVLDNIPSGEPTSIERQTFPNLIREKLPVFGFQSMDYWLDIGTAAKYRKAHSNILTGILPLVQIGQPTERGLWIGKNVRIASSVGIRGPVVIGDNSEIADGSLIIGPTVIGNNVKIGQDAYIEASVIWDDVILETRASMTETILGYGAYLKEDATLKEGCVVEDRYVVHADRVYVNDTVLSHSY